MADFKQMLAADRAVFLNIDEFGELHTVEGREIVVVVDDATLVDSKKAEQLGLAQGDLALFAKVEDLPARRASGESLIVDGQLYNVVTWDEDYGMASVFLSANMAG